MFVDDVLKQPIALHEFFRSVNRKKRSICALRTLLIDDDVESEALKSTFKYRRFETGELADLDCTLHVSRIPSMPITSRAPACTAFRQDWPVCNEIHHTWSRRATVHQAKSIQRTLA